MMNIKSKNEEFTLFNQLSDEWWNENLHKYKEFWELVTNFIKK